MAPDLVQRRFNPEAPNQLWSGDITYIATDEGWLYLAAVIDLFSRQVVGWSLQPTCRRSGQGRAGHGVVASAPADWSDIPQRQGQSILQRGVPGHFESLGHAFIDEQEGQLLGQRANGELLGSAENGQCAWSSSPPREQAKQAVMDWMAFYNHRRLHSSLGYLSPMQFEQRWYEAQRKRPRNRRAKSYTHPLQGPGKSWNLRRCIHTSYHQRLAHG